MPPRTATSPAKGKNGALLSKAEVKAALKEQAKAEAVLDQDLLRVSYEIGQAETQTIHKTDEVGQLTNQVQQVLGSSTDTVAHATTVHFAAQKENETRLDRLRERISNLETQLKDAETELANLKAEKKRVLAEKDSVIENQKREMKEMAYQFSDMLMKTLITITEDFESQTGDLDHDDTGLPGRERLKEFNLDRIRV